MKTLLVIATVLVLTSALPELKSQWIKFKSIHGKRYETPLEESKRFGIFQNNLKRIHSHNELFSKGLSTYKMAVNHFADLTPQEFLKFVNGSGPVPTVTNPLRYEKPQKTSRASQVDWRNQGIVTGVKNQGQCGSCWSFSATGALEGQWALSSGQLVSLSEQNLVDCSGIYGNQACNGGWMSGAFDYVRDYGIMSEDSYPYEAQLDYCRFDPNQSIFNARGHVELPQGSEDDLTASLGSVGPISIAIDASQNMQFYDQGIFYDEYCSSTQLNHGVLAVGYGQEGEYGYYLVKNSWGASWGESGYIKMIRNYGNNCGVASGAMYPAV